jgi:hypothetical protein
MGHEANYVVSGVGGKGRLMPASGVSWPAFGAYPESLIIRFTAGYETVPAPIVQAILLSLSYAGSLTATASADSGTGIKRKSVLNGLIDVTYMTPSESGSSSSGLPSTGGRSLFSRLTGCSPDGVRLVDR